MLGSLRGYERIKRYFCNMLAATKRQLYCFIKKPKKNSTINVVMVQC